MKSKNSILPKTITKIEYDNYLNELQNLKTITRKEISNEIQQARKKGVKGTAEYESAKDNQSKTEKRISEIEAVLKNAQVIDDSTLSDKIVLGSIVLLVDREYNEYVQYCIVNSNEVDSLNNKISNESPLGKALIGKKAGDSIKVSTKFGTLTYKVLKIEGMIDSYRERAIQELKATPKDNVNSTNLPDIELKDISIKDFVTRVNVFMCTNEKHHLIDIKCRIKVMTYQGTIDTYIIPGAYCETCNRYFILENDFQQLRNKGVLLCKIVEKEFWLTQSKETQFDNLNNESLLHLMGYNVNSKIALSQNQRWGILELLVDEHIMTVTEIRSHLQWLIRRTTNNRNFDDARQKWQNDIDHMSDYLSDNGTVVDVKSIKKVNYKTKK